MDCEYFTPDYDELLKLPESPEENTKMDEIDRKIISLEKHHQLEMNSLEAEMKEIEKSKQDYKNRLKRNEKLRERLSREVNESKIKEFWSNE